MIHYSRKQLDSYKRRAARAFPIEYMELMFGTIVRCQITVDHFVRVPQKGTSTYVNWLCDEQAQDLIAQTEATTGLDFIGTIHSHTEQWTDAHEPSGLDNRSSRDWEERIFAIDHIVKTPLGRRRHNILFYSPQFPLAAVECA